VLRLASVLWRLRRATTMETGLFEIQADHLRGYRLTHQLLEHSQGGIHAACERADLANNDSPPQHNHGDIMPTDAIKSDGSAIEFARCFLRLANLPNFVLDRLSRYEATLWRQATRILYELETLDRRKPQERGRRFWLNQIERE
jgi:hypothetical protein